MLKKQINYPAKRYSTMRIKVWCILALSLLSTSLIATSINATPAYAASITLNPTSGTVGTRVIVTGDGFTGRLATIKWDGKVAAERIPLSEKGRLEYTLSIPQAAKGSYTIEVTDDSHWSGSSASATFKILPKIEVFPRVARPTSEIVIMGTGFPAGETGITVTWDGATLKGTPASANLKGTWSISLAVPLTTKGNHYIGASGSITSAAEIGQIDFIVGPAARIEPLTGPVGTEIKAEGFGFRTGEDGITIAFDGEIIMCNIVGSGDGSWKATAQIPPSTRGIHTITVYGSSFTPIGTVPDVQFEVTPGLKLEPNSGNQGNKVTATGTGFDKNEIIAMTFGATNLDVSPAADDKGSFVATFVVPPFKGKNHTVTAVGKNGNSAKATFTANKPPPGTPQLKSPQPDVVIKIYDSVGDVFVATLKYAARLFTRTRNQQGSYSQAPKIIFIWTQPAHAEDAQYSLQVASESDFATPAMTKNNLQTPRYIVSQQDSLPPGTYYWRTRAIDSIGNESPWSEAWKFEVILMPSEVLILSIAIPALFTMLILAPIVIAWRSRRQNW
ncbi:MAG: hypothetical protein FJ024_01095 [Chloroflexi bacterium]|nr:hypothetical protein [Chloroflexota bacterium]